ncbi:MAG: hypothetical protein FWE12_06560 [Oscillospiraceae bacterium]|nr:hypothetical protein [Oscillospiraceae bacterium]
MQFATIFLMFTIAAFAFWLLWRQDLVRDTSATALSLLLLAGAFGARLYVIGFYNTDYDWFLSTWVQHYRDHGGFAGLAVRAWGENYNVPYLYFLALFSYIPLPSLHLIKLLGAFFDVVLAFFVMQTVGLYVRCDTRKRIVFFAVLYLPTVFLNSAYWGQCENIFTAFAVMSFYYAMRNRPGLSMVCIALSFAFKLQAIFLFPLYLLFLYGKKIRFQHLFLFPITYLLAILPAVFFGRPFWDTLLIYVNQANPATRGLNYNSPSLFALVQGWPRAPFTALMDTLSVPFLRNMGILLAFLFVFFLYYLVFRRQNGARPSGEGYLILALSFAIGVPFFLPQMHDRYFYMADIFAVILGLSRLRYLPAIALTQFASLLGYGVFLRHFATPPLPLPLAFPMFYGTIALSILLITLVWHLWRRPGSA